MHMRCIGAARHVRNLKPYARLALTLGIIGEAILIGLFDTIIHIVWPEPLVQQLLGFGEGIWY